MQKAETVERNKHGTLISPSAQPLCLQRNLPQCCIKIVTWFYWWSIQML